MKTLRYLYDFGDGWEHTVKIERAPTERETTYPRLIEATGRYPPEDVGGPPGYEELLEAITDRRHERHAEMREWCGDDFDPNALDTERLAIALAALARHWARKTAVNRKTTDTRS